MSARLIEDDSVLAMIRRQQISHVLLGYGLMRNGGLGEEPEDEMWVPARAEMHRRHRLDGWIGPEVTS